MKASTIGESTEAGIFGTLEEAVSLEILARRTPGFTGADLANLMNEAALLTARGNRKTIGMNELEEAIDRVIAGPERRTRVMSEKDKLVTAASAEHQLSDPTLVAVGGGAGEN